MFSPDFLQFQDVRHNLRARRGQPSQSQVAEISFGGMGRVKKRSGIHDLPGCGQGFHGPAPYQLTDVLVHQFFHPQYPERRLKVLSESAVKFLKCHFSIFLRCSMISANRFSVMEILFPAS